MASSHDRAVWVWVEPRLKLVSNWAKAASEISLPVGMDLALPVANKPKGKMKPTTPTACNRSKFPVIDWNYQPTINDYRGRCLKLTSPSFQNISRQYFQTEARQDFVVEAISFAVLAVIAVAPFVSTVNAVSELCRAFAQL
jgi:hypothetical protein